jgi:hypothetical protein
MPNSAALNRNIKKLEEMKRLASELEYGFEFSQYFPYSNTEEITTRSDELRYYGRIVAVQTVVSMLDTWTKMMLRAQERLAEEMP